MVKMCVQPFFLKLKLLTDFLEVSVLLLLLQCCSALAIAID